MFGVIRLLEASLVNIHRINIFWDFLVAHLDCLANSRWNELRAIAVDSLLCIIQNVFLSRNSLQIGDSSPSQMQSLKARGLEWQAAILEPLAQILNNHFVDTHLVMFQSFHRILEVLYNIYIYIYIIYICMYRIMAWRWGKKGGR